MIAIAVGEKAQQEGVQGDFATAVEGCEVSLDIEETRKVEDVHDIQKMLIWKKSSFCASRCTLAKGYKESRTPAVHRGVFALHPAVGRKL